MKSVSIIVPVYYGEKYISGIIEQVEACRKYLEMQDYVEVLFINDAPEAPLLSQWESEWVHIAVVNTDKNTGIHGARLKGLKRCKGEYVLFLDQDDSIRPEYLYSQLYSIGESDAVVCRAIEGGELFYSIHPIFENILSKELMLTKWNPIISPGQVLLRRQSIPNVWIENVLKYNGADDWFLWLCMLSKGYLFTLNQEVLYEHNLVGENASDDMITMLQSEQEVMSIVQERKLFSEEDFKLLMRGFFEKNVNRIWVLNSYKEKLNLLDRWVKLKEQNVKYSEYLIGLGLQTVAIYGCGVLGEYLYIELKNDLVVKYFIDRNASQIHKNIPVYSLNDKLPKVDGVIITLIGETNELERELEDILCSRVFVLKDWLKNNC